MTKFLFTLLCFIFTLPVFAENSILIMGDSLSAGYGIDPHKGWVSLLQEQLQKNHYSYRLVNASVSGYTTSNGLALLPKMLKEHRPVITIIELGGNDALRGLQPSLIKHNLQQLINLTKNTGSKVLLLAVRIPPNYGPVYLEKFQQVYAELQKENNVVLVPAFLKGVDDVSTLMQEDGIHPRVEAQRIMLNTVWPSLEKMLQEMKSKSQ